MSKVKTRQQKRKKRIGVRFGNFIDDETRQQVINRKLDAYESDFYDSPNRLAQEKSDDEYVINENIKKCYKVASSKLFKTTKKIKKKKCRTIFLKRNMNLKKLIKESELDQKYLLESKIPNFLNIEAKPGKKIQNKICSICSGHANYSCPRCRERYCSIRCQNLHKEIVCKNFGK